MLWSLGCTVYPQRDRNRSKEVTRISNFPLSRMYQDTPMFPGECVSTNELPILLPFPCYRFSKKSKAFAYFMLLLSASGAFHHNCMACTRFLIPASLHSSVPIALVSSLFGFCHLKPWTSSPHSPRLQSHAAFCPRSTQHRSHPHL